MRGRLPHLSAAGGNRTTALSAVLVVLLGVSPSRAQPPTDPVGHAWDRARWSLATGDTLEATVHLERALRAGTSSTSTVRALLLARALGSATDPPVDPDERLVEGAPRHAADWLTVLDRYGDGRFPWASDPSGVRDPGVRLLAAAASLDHGRPTRARVWLEDLDPPASLRFLSLHLHALVADAIGDEESASRHRRELVSEDPENELEGELVARAALVLAMRAAARGQDPLPWWASVPPTSVHAPSASLARIAWREGEVGPQATARSLDEWLSLHPDHPARDAARARRVAIALDTGDFATALDLATLRAGDRRSLRAGLEHTLEDSVALGALTRRLWATTPGMGLEIDPTPGRRARDELRRRLLREEDELPPAGPAVALRTKPTLPTFEGLRLHLEFDDLRRDRARTDSLSRVHARLRRALHEEDRLEAELEARDTYRARGRDRLGELEASLARWGSRLDTLATRGPALLASLRALEDSVLIRVERRSRALALRASDHARTAAGLRWLYAEGPMARRDPAPDPRVPLPFRLLRTEEDLAHQFGATLDSLRVRSRDTLRRSFSEVFAWRLTEGVQELGERVFTLRARGEELLATIDSTRARLRTDPRRLAARSAVERARHDLRELADRRERARRDAARGAIVAGLDALDVREEGIVYTLAVATQGLSLTADTDEEAATLRARTREWWSRFLALDPDPRVRGDARYRWADLELVDADAAFQRRMGEWLRENEGNTRSLAPLLDIERALDLLRALLEEDVDYARRDLALFQLGMLLADRGDPEAEEQLARLEREHPDSPLLQAARLRRGELAFDAERHLAAMQHLSAAAEGDDPEIRAVALYKLGWSANALGRSGVAIDAFLRLVDLHDDTTGTPSRVDLREEARGLLLRAIARGGGSDRFARTFDAAGERNWAPSLLADLSELLAGYALHEEAMHSDRLYLRRYPTHPGALDAARRLVDGSPRGGDREATHRALLEVAEHFRREGAWFAAQEADSLRAAADAFAREAIVSVAVARHRRARAEEEPGSFARARELYELLAARWSEHEQHPRWRVLAGECARATGDWPGALEHFAEAARDTGTVGADAAWQAVATADAWYVDSIGDGAEAGVDSLARRLLAVSDAHLARPDTRAAAGSDPRSTELAWRMIQIALAHGWDDEVIERSDRFVALHEGDPRALDARRLRAEALYRGEDFAGASSAFEEAWTVARASAADSVAAVLRPWIPHCLDLHARAVAAADTPPTEAAAEIWRDLARRWPDYERVDEALYRAGLRFEAVEADSAAIESWTRLVEEHGESALGADAYRNLARAHERRGHAGEAARTIEAFAAAHPRADDAADALLHAATLMESAGDDAGRTRILDSYMAARPDDLQTRSAVLAERASAELDMGAPGDAVDTYRAFATAHPGHARPGLLARIDLLRAESLVGTYESIPLRQPLPASLERKRDVLASLLEAYRAVVERGVAPHAQAAAFGIGTALVHMGDALLESERPHGLDGDDLVAYEEVLEGQAWSFLERGEEAWRELLRNHLRGDDESVDPWIEATRDALFPRTARRFLHQPSFEYPVMDAVSGTR